MHAASQTTLLAGLCDGSCRTIEELSVSVSINRVEVARALGRLVLRGYAERVERGCFQLTTLGRDAALSGKAIHLDPSQRFREVRKPASDTLRQRAWTAMRMSGAFTIGDLAMAAAREDDRGPEHNLETWLRALVRAGYVIQLPTRSRGTAPTSNGFKRFRLLKDSGPIAPVYRPARRTVYDHNSGEELPCAGPL